MLTPSGRSLTLWLLEFDQETGGQEGGTGRAYFLLTPLWHLLGLAVAYTEDTAPLPLAVFHTVFLHVPITTPFPHLLGPWAGRTGLCVGQRGCTMALRVSAPCPPSREYEVILNLS